ncbi:MAG: 1-deoxy-D-xylulose-5-phosphate synthase [Candidatus Omnitrophica bacterium]|nr:1-deoxy-D-xylulose-5-phosphate synthase [Candidatus Omnitrophota bacterium]
MRNAFASTILDIAQMEPRVLLLTGDLGFMVLEPFQKRYPERFINVGVSEQNLLGLATGLAEAGWIPYVYSIANFIALRPYEFIRNGPVLHRLPVRIVGIGDGFDYGHAGPTHLSIDDVGVLRTLPGMEIIAPATPGQAREALLKTYASQGPIYYRLGKSAGGTLPPVEFHSGKVEWLRNGKDVVLLTMGGIAAEALSAAAQLEALGISAAVIAVAHISPTPQNALFEVLKKFPLAATIEAHSVQGGLGSMVAEVIAEGQMVCRLLRFGVRKPFDGRSGSLKWLLREHGLDAASVSSTLHKMIRNIGEQ